MGDSGRQDHNQASIRQLMPVIVGALGVVFGDIGTSPLYALRECFGPHYGLSLTPDNVLGLLSLIFWTMTIVISCKYMLFVLEADNRGEGGILALTALATMAGRNSRLNSILLFPLGLIGASLLFGEGVITPAITVLSAIEGINVVTTRFEHFVVPITITIIVFLFLVQKQGAGRIGAFFGPVITVWFLSIAALGIGGIVTNPSVLWALNPMAAVGFFLNNGTMGFFVLAAVVLVITGGEALYADMGHFGRRPIRLAWFWCVFPALMLNYFGQGALLLANPEAIENPFYLLAPKPLVLPMVILATAASVIASQALISGVFSLSKQAIQLGYMPRLQVVHTSVKEMGQIYVPFLNWALLTGVVWLVVTFKTSSALASAYGIAVMGTMSITTILAFVVARRLWRWKLWTSIIFLVGFLIVDFSLLIACFTKFFDGGWVPIAIGATIYTLASTWQKGRRLLVAHLKTQSMPVEAFLHMINEHPPVKVSGTAIYMSGDPFGVPIPLLHNLKHNRVIHSRVVILTIATREIPYYKKQDRVRVETITRDFYRVTALYGFMEMPKIREILEACKEKGLEFQPEQTTFVLGRETILPSDKPGMSIWREKLFALMSRNAQRPTAYFDIPVNQVIEVGIQVEI